MPINNGAPMMTFQAPDMPAAHTSSISGASSFVAANKSEEELKVLLLLAFKNDWFFRYVAALLLPIAPFVTQQRIRRYFWAIMKAHLFLFMKFVPWPQWFVQHCIALGINPPEGYTYESYMKQLNDDAAKETEQNV